MVRHTLFVQTFLCVTFAVRMAFPQASCIPWVIQPCDGVPQNMECVKVTTALSGTLGGKSSKILQEYCFREDSPLFGSSFDETVGITILVDGGSIDFASLTQGTAIGGLRFDVNLALFGETCEQGDHALLTAPIVVLQAGATWAEVEAAVDEASEPIKQCVLDYDPLLEDHNFGLMFQGELTKEDAGGFKLFLRLASLGPNASNPGLEYKDLVGTGSPVPVYFQPITKDNLFILPPAGGTLTVTTTIAASNVAGDTVAAEFVESFTITPGVVVPPITGLACTPQPTKTVQLAWTNGGTYTGIEVLIDGSAAAGSPLAGAATSFETAALSDGSHTIALTPIVDTVRGTATSCTVTIAGVAGQFKRGDTNGDDTVNIADAVCALTYLFGSPTDICKTTKVPSCFDAADANDDGQINVADPIKILAHLFAKAGPLPLPFGECGSDPAVEPPHTLKCTTYAPCPP